MTSRQDCRRRFHGSDGCVWKKVAERAWVGKVLDTDLHGIDTDKRRIESKEFMQEASRISAAKC